MASLFKRGAYFYAQWHDAARQPARRRVALKTSNRRAAESLLKRLGAAYETGDWDPWVEPLTRALGRPEAPLTLQQAARRFLEAKQPAIASTTLKAYQCILGIVGRDLGSRRVASITGGELAAVILDARVSRSTQAQRHRVMWIFFNWCVREGIASRHPMPRRCPVRQVETRPRAVTPDDLRQITDAIRRDYREKRSQCRCAEGDLVWMIPVFEFAFLTGLRVSELARLRWKDVDLDGRRITIERQKSGRVSVLPLSVAATDVLSRVLVRHDMPFIFGSPKATGSTRSTAAFVGRVSSSFTRYRKLAGIDKPLTFHGLRHGFCTALAEAGQSAHVIRAAARHTSLAVSQRYVHLTGEELRRRLDDVFSICVDTTVAA